MNKLFYSSAIALVWAMSAGALVASGSANAADTDGSCLAEADRLQQEIAVQDLSEEDRNELDRMIEEVRQLDEAGNAEACSLVVQDISVFAEQRQAAAAAADTTTEAEQAVTEASGAAATAVSEAASETEQAVTESVNEAATAAAETVEAPAEAANQAASEVQETVNQAEPGLDPSVAALTVADLEGENVYDSNGEDVGALDQVVVGPDGKLFAVIGMGGFLGIGDTDVLIPLRDLQIRDERIALPVYSEEELERMQDVDLDEDSGYEILDGDVRLIDYSTRG